MNIKQEQQVILTLEMLDKFQFLQLEQICKEVCGRIPSPPRVYDKVINVEYEHHINRDDYTKFILKEMEFSEIKNFEKYLKPFINNFEQSFVEDFNQNTNQNILILNSKKDWLLTFEKNTENQFDLSALKKLKDFNKYTLKLNEDIYSIYSKDILEEKNDAIKQLTFENIYSIESRGLQFISNFLIDTKKLETISKKFFNLKSYKDESTFLYTKVDIKDENSNKIKYLLENYIDCNEDISQYSRKNKTAALADLFDSLVP